MGCCFASVPPKPEATSITFFWHLAALLLKGWRLAKSILQMRVVESNWVDFSRFPSPQARSAADIDIS